MRSVKTGLTDILHVVPHELGAAKILSGEWIKGRRWLTFSKSEPSYITAVKFSCIPTTHA
jgi:hypothetical protein